MNKLFASFVLCAFVGISMSRVSPPDFKHEKKRANFNVIWNPERDEEDWANWKNQHKKEYDSFYEDRYRFNIFSFNRDTINTINTHNIKYMRGETSYSLCINKYSYLSYEEIIDRMYGTFYQQLNETCGVTFIPPADIKLPESVDWVKQGAVTPVKDENYCPASWAFSATGAIEGQHFRKTGNLVSLSEQNLIDCSGRFGNKGCKGGSVGAAFEYVEYNKGIDTSESYPYQGQCGTCKYTKENSSATVACQVVIKRGDETALQAAVASVGPISIAIDASDQTFLSYSRGVYDPTNCRSDTVNHGMLVVGYGVDNTTPYWLVKNSWGTSWGEGGYIKIIRNKNNKCGVASVASYPLV